MSIVTDLVVHTAWLEGPATIRAFVDWYEHPIGPDNRTPGPIARLGLRETARDGSRVWGGRKTAESDLWGGSYNHFPLEEFLELLQSLDWVAPTMVQVLVKLESNPRAAIYTLDGDRRIVELVDGGGDIDELPHSRGRDIWPDDPELRRRFGM